MKKITAILLTISMIMGLTACGDNNSSSEKADSSDKSSESSLYESSSSSESTTKESSQSEAEAEESLVDGLTKAEYDSMTAEDLLKHISNPEKVTAEEYVWLISTLAYVDIENEEKAVNYMGLTQNITEEAIHSIKSKARPEPGEYMDKLLESPVPQIRGYAMSQMTSLFGVSDANLERAKKLLETEEDTFVLYCAINALSNELTKDKAFSDFAYKMSESPDPKLRFKAAVAIGNYWSRGVEGAADKIIEMMNDSDPEIKKIACERAGGLNDDAVIEPLVKIINDPQQAKFHYSCVYSLMDMWYDYPFHDDTNEKAYKAAMDYFKTSARNNDTPAWNAIGLLKNIAEDKYDDWKKRASYFDTDDLYDVMTEIVRDENANWMARTAAVDVIKIHCSSQQFDELGSTVAALSDKKADYIKDEYDKQKG